MILGKIQFLDEITLLGYTISHTKLSRGAARGGKKKKRSIFVSREDRTSSEPNYHTPTCA